MSILSRTFYWTRWVVYRLALLLLILPLLVPASRVQSSPGQVHNLEGPAAPGIDLDVTYIQRTPLYKAYCVEYPWDVPNQPGIPYLCPGTEDDPRWPDPGEPVTFTAHVVNKGASPAASAGYEWQIDGVTVSAGTLPALDPAAETTVNLVYPWPHGISADGQRALGDHRVRFQADPAGLIGETHEGNNSLEDATNSMSFSIYITPEMYTAYNIPVDVSYPASAEDWLQKQIAAMNANFASSTYPVTPDGASLRVRINKIEVISSNPGGDGEHDGGWFVDADYRHGASAYYDPATDIDWGLIHELSHQVSLIDLYAINASPPTIWVVDRNGNPANFAFAWTNPDLMGGGDISPHTNPNLYSSHSAGGASTYSGYRNGYYGSHQFDIPLDNFLLVSDAGDQPAAGVQVTLYQRTGPYDWSGNLGIDGTPEIEGVTDANGVFHLPNRSANGGTTTQNGHILHDNPFGVVDIIGSQNLFLGRLAKGTHEEFFWLDITDFNLAYWEGDTDSHTFELATHLPVDGAPASPTITDTRLQGEWVTVCWSPGPSPGVTGYRVYRAVPPDFQYVAAGSPVSGPCFSEILPAPWSYDGHVYTVVAVDGQGRESGFSNFAWATDLVNPAALVITPQDQRIVLDPQNGYALLRQDAAGRFIQTIGSVHFHLEKTWYMSQDANGRLLFSHPGDWYDPRHSVRMADLNGTPLLEFGQRGAGPGEFEIPAGVAAWGVPCTIDQAYSVDANTLLLLHFDGSYDGAQGETGIASGTSFDSGRFGQGVRVDGTDVLTYPTAGNLLRTQGSIEFWIKPDWNGDDGLDYGFFEVGDEWHNRIRIQKDGANNLRFLLWDSTQEYGLAYGVSHWKAGEWHHLAVTWQEPKIALFVDGNQVASDDNSSVPDSLDDTMQIGSMTVWVPARAQAVIDELRISDIPRLGNSQVCNRILVADSGNHRIQAFDSLGNFISSFGSSGSGTGQFNTPQGLAVDGQGRVIVADRGNNRLVFLDFDGQSFTYHGSLGGWFDHPNGLWVDEEGWIYVADTGHNRIVRTNQAGTSISLYTQPNDGYTGTFLAPRGVAVDADGDILVADTGNRRVAMMYAKRWLYLPLIGR